MDADGARADGSSSGRSCLDYSCVTAAEIGRGRPCRPTSRLRRPSFVRLQVPSTVRARLPPSTSCPIDPSRVTSPFSRHEPHRASLDETRLSPPRASMPPSPPERCSAPLCPSPITASRSPIPSRQVGQSIHEGLIAGVIGMQLLAGRPVRRWVWQAGRPPTGL